MCPVQEGEPSAGCGRQRYRERLEVERNWLAGKCTWRQLLGHNDYVRCAQQHGGLLASCSGSHMRQDCSIRRALLQRLSSGAPVIFRVLDPRPAPSSP